MASVIRGSDNFDSLIAKFDAGKSLTENGYQKLSNGLIIQWGKLGDVGATLVNNYQINFPITFNTACLNISLTYYFTSGTTYLNTAANPTVNSTTTSSFRYSGHTTSGATKYGPHWVAIGY